MTYMIHSIWIILCFQTKSTVLEVSGTFFAENWFGVFAGIWIFGFAGGINLQNQNDEDSSCENVC